MSPKKVYNLPPNLTFDASSGRYLYRSPETKQRTTISRDKDEAIEKANRLNAALEIRKQHRIHNKVDPDFGSVIDSYIVESVPVQPWGELHTKNIMAGLNAIKNDLGRLPFSKIDRLVIARWIEARGVAGHQKRRYRLTFIRIYDYAIGKKWCNYNEGQAVQSFSRSKKLAENRTKRKRMSLDQFWLIHKHAPLYIQVAMELSLVTLQGRQEVLNMQYSDIRDGFLFVIRKKTAAESSAAFIKVEMNSEIERIVSLSRSSKIVSPYLVHRLPKSRQKSRKHDAPHPTHIIPQQFTYNFGYARDRAGVTQQFQKGEAPTFHEIRSLGSRIMQDQGVPKGHISRLLAHGSVSTSEIYLDGRDALSDADFLPVQTTIRLNR